MSVGSTFTRWQGVYFTILFDRIRCTTFSIQTCANLKIMRSASAKIPSKLLTALRKNMRRVEMPVAHALAATIENVLRVESAW